MGHTISTLDDGDLLRRHLEIFHNKLKFIKTINRQYDDRFAIEGAKNGGNLLIRDPNEFDVVDGAVMNTVDITETTQTLTVATQKHIPLPSFSSLDRTMSVQDYEDNYVMPAMSKLAAIVEFTVLSDTYKKLFNLTGASTMATTPNTFLAALNANARLTQCLAPDSDRHMLMNSQAMAATVNAIGTYFHKSSEIERSFSEGYIGQAANMQWRESEMVPSHTNGDRDDTTPVTDTSAGTFINGATTLVTTGFDVGTLKAGDVFTIGTISDGVLAVNRETKQAYDYLQQFVVRTDKTLDATDTIDIAPTIYLSGPKQNMKLQGTPASMALINDSGINGGSGTGEATYVQNLAYQRNFCTFVSADLKMIPGERMERKRMEGISMRYWEDGDIVNDKGRARIDVIFGSKVLRPEWGTRVRG